MPNKCHNKGFVACNLREPNDDCVRVMDGCPYPIPQQSPQAASEAGSECMNLLNAELCKRDKLLNDIYDFLNYSDVPTQYATNGYREEYLGKIKVLRDQMENALGI